MIYQEQAKFYDFDATIFAKLSNGEEAIVNTQLNSEGLYSDYWESPTGYAEHGEVHYQECELFDNSIKVTYPDEWIYTETGEEGPIGVTIIELIEVKRVDWKVDEESL